MKKLSSVVLLFALICAPIAKGATASEESKSERVPVKSLLMNGFGIIGLSLQEQVLMFIWDNRIPSMVSAIASHPVSI